MWEKLQYFAPFSQGTLRSLDSTVYLAWNKPNSDLICTIRGPEILRKQTCREVHSHDLTSQCPAAVQSIPRIPTTWPAFLLFITKKGAILSPPFPLPHQRLGAWRVRTYFKSPFYIFRSEDRSMWGGDALFHPSRPHSRTHDRFFGATL